MSTLPQDITGEIIAETEQGVILCDIPRYKNRILRVKLKTYKGHKFIDVQEGHEAGSDWIPHTSKFSHKATHITIRADEITTMIRVLTEAQEKLHARSNPRSNDD